jgi:hypothetical protein
VRLRLRLRSNLQLTRPLTQLRSEVKIQTAYSGAEVPCEPRFIPGGCEGRNSRGGDQEFDEGTPLGPNVRQPRLDQLLHFLRRGEGRLVLQRRTADKIRRKAGELVSTAKTLVW